MFDSMYGYSLNPAPHSLGRDFDADDLPTERDPDSDNGGCLDGIEDADRNGQLGGKETWNFNDIDDGETREKGRRGGHRCDVRVMTLGSRL